MNQYQDPKTYPLGIQKSPLSLVRHHDLQAWDEENMPYTMRRNRSDFYSQNMGH